MSQSIFILNGDVYKRQVEKNIPAVICTTGLSDETMDMLKKASEKVAMFKSANMSLGINLIATILKKYSDAVCLLYTSRSCYKC